MFLQKSFKTGRRDVAPYGFAVILSFVRVTVRAVNRVCFLCGEEFSMPSSERRESDRRSQGGECVKKRI